jgi:hypothetical protein
MLPSSRIPILSTYVVPPYVDHRRSSTGSSPSEISIKLRCLDEAIGLGFDGFDLVPYTRQGNLRVVSLPLRDFLTCTTQCLKPGLQFCRFSKEGWESCVLFEIKDTALCTLRWEVCLSVRCGWVSWAYGHLVAAPVESKATLTSWAKVVWKDTVTAGYMPAWESDCNLGRAVIIDINPLISTFWILHIFSVGTTRAFETEFDFTDDTLVCGSNEAESSYLVQCLTVALESDEGAIFVNVGWQEVRLRRDRRSWLVRKWCSL